MTLWLAAGDGNDVSSVVFDVGFWIAARIDLDTLDTIRSIRIVSRLFCMMVDRIELHRTFAIRSKRVVCTRWYMVHGTVLQTVHCTDTDQQPGAQRPAASSKQQYGTSNGRSGSGLLRKAEKQKSR